MSRLTGDKALVWAEVMRRICVQRGWVWRDMAWAINVFGFRSNNSQAGIFDDEAQVIYKHPELGLVVDRYCITTDPGPRYLERPIHPRGGAILAHGHQYWYRVGWHRAGRAPGYKACNQMGKVLVYRDDDRNDILSYDVESIMVGRFGINHHHGGEDSPPGSLFRGKSAGCQVWASMTEFNEGYLPTVIKSEEHHGPGFPYAVLLQSEVDAAYQAYVAELALKAQEAPKVVWEFFD